MGHRSTILFFWVSSVSTTDFCFLSFDDRKEGRKMAANSEMGKNSWRTQYTPELAKLGRVRIIFRFVRGGNYGVGSLDLSRSGKGRPRGTILLWPFR